MTQVSKAVLLAALGTTCAVAGAAPSAAEAKKGEPLVEQMVVLRDGTTTLRTVAAKRTTFEVEGRDCVVPAGTAMASLLQTRWRSQVRLRDYGSCSNRPIDSAGLFVKVIRRDVNRGLNGWVYKVGRKLGTAGAADPAGPFGAGRLRSSQRVVWLYCVFVEASCQRSLEINLDVSGRSFAATVTGYNDAGEGVPIAGARITARVSGGTAVAAISESDGRATLVVPATGRYVLRASKAGLIPAFPEKVDVD